MFVLIHIALRAYVWTSQAGQMPELGGLAVGRKSKYSQRGRSCPPEGRYAVHDISIYGVRLSGGRCDVYSQSRVVSRKGTVGCGGL